MKTPDLKKEMTWDNIKDSDIIEMTFGAYKLEISKAKQQGKLSAEKEFIGKESDKWLAEVSKMKYDEGYQLAQKETAEKVQKLKEVLFEQWKLCNGSCPTIVGLTKAIDEIFGVVKRGKKT